MTPYSENVQKKIIDVWGANGMACAFERHLNLQDNFSFAEVGSEEVARNIRAVAQEGADAVAVVCTNMRGADLTERLENKLGIPIYDSIATTLWACLLSVGVDPAGVEGWGSLFKLRPGAR